MTFFGYTLFKKNLSSSILARLQCELPKITDEYCYSFLIPLLCAVTSPNLSIASPLCIFSRKNFHLHSHGTLCFIPRRGVCHHHVETQRQLPSQEQTAELILEMLCFLQPCPPDGGVSPCKHRQSYFTGLLPTLL